MLCNLCGFPIIKINNGSFGLRCIKCRSTFIHRAMGEVIKNFSFSDDLFVYEMSKHGAIFKFLQKEFKNFTFSEYFEEVKSGTFKNGILCQDAQNLSFNDRTFDLITSTEVFEHVPNDSIGFSEIYRVLNLNGYFIFTVPLYDEMKTVERAILKNGRIEHLHEPEYHGDHLKKDKGILAFRNYGLDIKDKLENIGFNVEIKQIENRQKGIFPSKKVIICRKIK